MRKILKWIFVVVAVGVIGWAGLKWYGASAISPDALNLIPKDAVYCIATRDPVDSWKQIAGSAAWRYLQTNAYFASLTQSANKLDSLLRRNDLLFELVGSRTLIVSAIITGYKRYDFLFLVDLEEVSGIKFLNEYISYFTTAGVTISRERYGGNDLLTIHNPSDNSNLYLSMQGSYLLLSYTRQIVTSVLDTKRMEGDSDPEEAGSFLTRSNDLVGNRTLDLYVNYAMLPRWMACYSNGSNEYINRLATALRTTSLTLSVGDSLLKAEGHTYINDSVESYLKTLATSGKGPSEVLGIVPGRTAFFAGLGFTTFDEFFENFQKNLRQDIVEYDRYRESVKQLEEYLKIDIKKNFTGWIGNEVALVEMQSNGEGVDNETALILKAKDIEKAKEALIYVERMIRKRTPVKFKTIVHRDHEINYISVKGLFRILLGKFFARYDKPYYTIVDDFVIFSNHPQTLISMIDDYLDHKTIKESREFESFRKEFESESAVFICVHTPVLFNTVKKMVDSKTMLSMETNKEFIICFPYIGFQMVPKDGGFKTIFAGQFKLPGAPLAEEWENEASGLRSPDEDPTEVPSADADPMTLPYIYPGDTDAPSYTGYFPDSTIHFEVELKNGFRDGAFTEYYADGKIKMRGHFKKNKRDGIWRLFDRNGKLLIRRNYDNNVVVKEKSLE